MGQIRNVFYILVGKPERKNPLAGLRKRGEDNIKPNLKIWCEHAD
jgi:hypothetical protein